MNAYELRQLKAQLYISFPLIGRWLQRAAARKLARSGAPRALAALGETLGVHPDPVVQRIAQETILKASAPASIDAVCQAWAGTRNPWLGALIRQRGWCANQPAQVRVLSALQAHKPEALADAGANLVAELVKACQDTDPAIAALAVECLQRLTRRAAIDAFCAQWAESRAPHLEDILLRSGYIAHRPPNVRLLSALKQGQIEIARRGKDSLIPALFQAAEDRDPFIATQARQALGELKDSAARETVCRAVLEQEHPLAQEAAMQGGYLPGDAFQRALFLFFTGQWQAYQALDFEQRVLRSTYDTASPTQRQRILEKIRASGQVELLRAISARQVAVPDIAEADALVQLLSEHQEWQQMWRRVFEFPLKASLQILRRLAAAQWQPADAEERAALQELTALAQGDLEISAQAFFEQLPPALLQARANLKTGRINDVAFAPNDPVIAVGTSERRVAVWDFQHARRRQVFKGFAHSIGNVIFSQTGQILAAERTNEKTPCQVYVQRGDKLEPAWQFNRSITALEPLGSNQVVAAGRDSTIMLLELGEKLNIRAQRQLPGWPRVVEPSPDRSRLAVLHEGFMLLSLPDLNTLEDANNFHGQGVRCAAIAPDGQTLLLGRSQGQVEAHPLANPVGHPFWNDRHPQRVQGIEALKNSAVVLSVDASGEIHFTAWADRPLAGKIVSGSAGANDLVTSLHVSPDESFMALGHANAHLSLWDLRPLSLPSLLRLPLIHSTPNHLAALELVQGQPDLSEKTRRTLALLIRLLRHRFRYDIEVGDTVSIQVGEYDIEIE